MRCFDCLLIGIACLLMGTLPAAAATFVVDSTVDTVDTNPGDGVCATAAGACTLRAAIQEANALAGGDTITLPAGTYTLNIAGTDEDESATGDLDITDDLTVNGAGAATTIIDGGGLDRIFHLLFVTVEISDVTIRNGLAGSGGGIEKLAGAAILTNVTVSGNSAQIGGGIENFGTLTLNSTTVNGNTAFGDGGGIRSVGTLTLNSSNVSDNTALGVGGGGGGIGNFGTLILVNSTVSGNSMEFGSGGGIRTAGSFFTPATLTLDSSTVSGNSARNGGGIAVDIFSAASLTNSTVSGNTAGSPDVLGVGGGIVNLGSFFQPTTLTLDSSTIADNVVFGDGGGINNAFGGTVNLKNTLVANNASGDCSGDLISAGHNLIEDTAGCAILGDTTGNIIGSDPLLGPLADNGGLTFTHALLAGSPAIDAGSPDCPPPATDQRGVARPADGDGDSVATCDIGAFEFVAVPPALLVLIDIKPARVNPKSRGVIPVAILTTDTFDATTVDPLSVRFGPNGATEAHGRGHLEDVNGDGRLDLVLHFRTQGTGIQCGDTSASLTGETQEGQLIEGSDSVATVGCK